MVGADRASFFIADYVAKELWTKVAEGADEIRMPLSSGIVGFVAMSQEIVNVRDAYLDPRFNKAIDLETGYRTKSILCVPILDEGRAVGVIQLINKKEEECFSENDSSALTNFADQIAVAIKNTMRFESTKQGMEKAQNSVLELGAQLSITKEELAQKEMDERFARSRMLKALSASKVLTIRDELHSLFKVVLEEATSLFDCERGTLFLVDKETNSLYSMVAGGTSSTIRIPIGSGIAGHVASSATTSRVNDAYEDPRFNAKVDKEMGFHTKNILASPVLSTASGAVTGVVQVINKDVSFTEEDQVMLEAFAAQIGFAIDSGRTTLNSKRELEKSAKSLEELLSKVNEASREKKTISQDLGRKQATLHLARRVAGLTNLDELFTTVALDIRGVLDVDRVTLFVVDAVKGEIWSQVAEGSSETFSLRLGEGIAGSVAQIGKPVSIADAYNHPLFNPAFDKKSGYVTKSLLCVPCVDVNDAVVGVIQAINKTSGEFSEGDKALLENIAEQIGPSLRQMVNNSADLSRSRSELKSLAAQLQVVKSELKHEQNENRDNLHSRTRAEKLLRIAQVAASRKEMSQLFKVVLHEVHDLLDADRASLFLVDEDTNSLWTEVAEGSAPIRISMDSGIVGYVARMGEALTINDAYADSRFNSKHDKSTGYVTRTMLTSPIKSNDDGRVLGVLQVINKANGERFDDNDGAILSSLCGHISVAVESYRSDQASKNALSKSLAELKDLDAKLDDICAQKKELENEIGSKNELVGELESFSAKMKAENRRLELSNAAKERLEKVVVAAKMLSQTSWAHLASTVEGRLPLLMEASEMRLYAVDASALKRICGNGNFSGSDDDGMGLVGQCFNAQKFVHGLGFRIDTESQCPQELCAPLLLPQNGIVGVLQMIRYPKDANDAVPFSKDDIVVATRLAVFVARSVYNIQHRASARIERTKLQKTLDEKGIEIEKMRIERTRLENAWDEKEIEFKRLENALDEKHRSLKEAEEEIRDANAEIARLKDAKRIMQSDLDMLRNQIVPRSPQIADSILLGNEIYSQESLSADSGHRQNVDITGNKVKVSLSGSPVDLSFNMGPEKKKKKKKKERRKQKKRLGVISRRKQKKLIERLSKTRTPVW